MSGTLISNLLVAVGICVSILSILLVSLDDHKWGFATCVAGLGLLFIGMGLYVFG